MKAIRMTAMLAALALLCTLPAMAQESGQSKPEGGGQAGNQAGNQAGGQRRMMSPEERLKRMTDQLTLTQEQQDKIKPILEDQQKQMEELRAAGGPPDRDKMMKMRSETNDKIKAVLNDDQKKKFDEMNQRGPMGGGPRQGGEKPKDEGGQKPPQ